MLPNEHEIECLRKNLVASLKSELEVAIYVYGNQFDRKTVHKWLTTFRFFKPTRMRMNRNGTYCSKRYNESVFNDVALDEKVTFLCLEDAKWGSIKVDLDGMTASFIVKIPIKLWMQQKTRIIDAYQKIFVELGGCFGYVVNCFDYEIIQNPRDADVYKRYKLNDSDFPGINEIPIIPRDCSRPYPMYQIDTSYLPGYKKKYGKITFTTAPYMWFGPDYTDFFSKERLDKFNNCQENNEFAVGYRRICLWDNIEEYNASVYRERQWDFLKEIGINEIVDELNRKPFISNNSKHTFDPSVEFERGSFSHGGTLLARFYVDGNGNACSKSVAHACVQREMQGHTIVWQERTIL